MGWTKPVLKVKQLVSKQLLDYYGDGIAEALQRISAIEGGVVTAPSTGGGATGNTFPTLPGISNHWAVAGLGTDNFAITSLPSKKGLATSLSAGNEYSATYKAAGFGAARPALSFPLNALQTGPVYRTTTALYAEAPTLTVAGVIKPAATPSGTDPLCIIGREGAFFIRLSHDLKPQLLVSDSGVYGDWDVNTTASTAVSSTAFSVFVLTLDGTNAKLAINGANVITQPFTGTLGSNTQPFCIGGGNNNGSPPFQGLLGDVVVCTGVLGGTDLTNLTTYLAASATP